MARTSYKYSHGNFYVDTSALTDFGKALHKLEPAVYRRLRKDLRLIGKKVADDAKSRAAFSTRLPGSIKVRTRGIGVSVIAGGESCYQAYIWENNGKGHVRHPVFAKRGSAAYANKGAWTDKNSPPAFLKPAVDANEAFVIEAADAALVAAAREVGLSVD